MAPSYTELLSQPAAKPSRRAELLRLAMEILTLATIDESPDEGVVPRLTGTEPEIYVAPRYSPSP